MLPTMALILAIIPGIHHKLIKMNTSSSSRKDDYLKIISISKFSDGALFIVANLTGHSSLIIITHFKNILIDCFTLGASPSIKKYRKLFFRILLGSWFLAILVLVNAYSSLLISYLTIPTLMPVAKNFDDLAYRRVRHYEGITQKGGLSDDLMFVSIYYLYTKIKLVNHYILISTSL